jgi:hypothetical protein
MKHERARVAAVGFYLHVSHDPPPSLTASNYIDVLPRGI